MTIKLSNIINENNLLFCFVALPNYSSTQKIMHLFFFLENNHFQLIKITFEF